MLDYNIFKPIRNFGALILASGVAGLFCMAIFFNDPNFFVEAKIFVFVVSAFNLFMGYNIVARNRFGYRSLRIYLYLIYPGFPLGYSIFIGHVRKIYPGLSISIGVSF